MIYIILSQIKDKTIKHEVLLSLSTAKNSSTVWYWCNKLKDNF